DKEEVSLMLNAGVPRLVFQYEGVTDAGGGLRLAAITPGDYVIQTSQPVPQVGCCFRSVVTRQAMAKLAPGDSGTLKLGGTDLPRLEGAIRDKAGDPLHGVWVRLIPANAAALNGPVWSTVTERDGRYVIYDVPEGAYELRCFRRLALNDGSRTLQ